MKTLTATSELPRQLVGSQVRHTAGATFRVMRLQWLQFEATDAPAPFGFDFGSMASPDAWLPCVELSRDGGPCCMSDSWVLARRHFVTLGCVPLVDFLAHFSLVKDQDQETSRCPECDQELHGAEIPWRWTATWGHRHQEPGECPRAECEGTRLQLVVDGHTQRQG